MPVKQHLGDGVFAERLADGTIRISIKWAPGIGGWKHFELSADVIAALAQFSFAKENDDAK